MDSRSLRAKASEETLISLLQLDPSPIETPLGDVDKDLPTLPEDATESSGASYKSPSSAPGLSGTGHGAIFYLTRVQKFSSYLIPVFASIHLANTSIIPLVARSVAASETYLLLSREIYQTSFAEPILVAFPIFAHVLSGVALRLLRRSQILRRYGGNTPGMYALYRAQTGTASHSFSSSGTNSAARIWPPLSYISASGYTFAMLLAAHVGINRVLPVQVEGDSSNIGLAFVAHGFARHPLFWATYVGLLAVGCGHMVWGSAKWLGLAPAAMGWSGSGSKVLDKETRKRRRRSWWALHGASAAAFAVWAAGGLGVVARGGLTDGWVGKLYDELFSRVPLL
ncbi:N2,N2-dimethylguanosine tRNA methyltransferase [Colletotrichum musicola]|uniref:N2,N2-dimethylguanosine tRNA methyltransferase n=1 Tax=Colletotrichum musicola TaxID=2175873 RepID=A0A8H6N0Y5_9PEZI|nr:N2,N2-dimethylguanosine tRNA methyltransferase [Colletotrichum musicola]